MIAYFTKFSDFLRRAYKEFKLVTWPTRQQTARLTGYVIGVSLLIGFFVSAVDYLLTKGLSLVIR